MGRKILWHRQLWQDVHGRELQAHEEIHHRDGDKGNNCLGNLQKTDARVHRQHHGRERRVVVIIARQRTRVILSFLSFFVPFSFLFGPISFLFFSFRFPFLVLFLSFSFPFPFPLPFLFFLFPSFTIPFPSPFPLSCESCGQGVKPALGKTIRGKTKR